MMVVFLALALAGVIVLTRRLWEIWSGVRRLLAALDSQPLRSGFSKMEGLSWKPIWRLGTNTIAEFQRMQPRQREALSSAMNTVPELAAAKAGLDDAWKNTLSCAEEARSFKWPWLRHWHKRREAELHVLRQFRCYQVLVGQAAGVAFDYLARRWSEEYEHESRLDDRDAFKMRACERFICLLYLNFLLAMLGRIRTLIVAVGGMYVLILIGTTQYPFEPRAAFQLLLVVLLVYLVAIVGLVFAQVHRDATLSHITATEPGKLGGDFWLRLASFAALPLFSLLTSQFPSANRALYSWIQPAIEALNR